MTPKRSPLISSPPEPAPIRGNDGPELTVVRKHKVTQRDLVRHTILPAYACTEAGADVRPVDDPMDLKFMSGQLSALLTLERLFGSDLEPSLLFLVVVAIDR